MWAAWGGGLKGPEARRASEMSKNKGSERGVRVRRSVAGAFGSTWRRQAFHHSPAHQLGVLFSYSPQFGFDSMPPAKNKCPKCKHTNAVRKTALTRVAPNNCRFMLANGHIRPSNPPTTLHPLRVSQIPLAINNSHTQDGWNFCSNCAYKNTQAQASCAYHFVVMGSGGVGKSAVTIQVCSNPRLVSIKGHK